MHIKYIVGNKFKNFSQNEHVILLADINNVLKRGLNPFYPDTTYIFGQGVSFQQERNIKKQLSQLKPNNLMNLHFRHENVDKASKNTSHKHKHKNILISAPIKNDDQNYHSELLIDDNCAEMSDHTTGQHIQGMIVIEAARQMMLAVTESYILDENNRGNMYFILNYVTADFKGFLFPIDSQIEYKIISNTINDKGNVYSDVMINFMQNKQLKAVVEIKFSAYHKQFMEGKETKIASDALQEKIKETTKIVQPIVSLLRKNVTRLQDEGYGLYRRA